MIKHRIAVLVGSLRKDSLNRKMANNLIRLSPDNLDLHVVEVRALPLYNEDLEDSTPREWTEFRNRLREFDGVLFVTPEYNRSVPGVLKNAIDIGSRPYGKSIWAGKPAAIMSVSPGTYGGFGANHHLRQSMVFLDMPAMQQPEAYIAKAADQFDEQGELVMGPTRDLAVKFMRAFSDWVKINVEGRKLP